MSASSIKRFTLTRRVVASSGIAAALFVAGPVAVAAADDGTSTTSDSSTSTGVSTAEGDAEDGDNSPGSDAGVEDAEFSTDVETTADQDSDPTDGAIAPESPGDSSTTPEPAPAGSSDSPDPVEPVAPTQYPNFPLPEVPAEDVVEYVDEDAPTDGTSDNSVDTHTPAPGPLVDHTAPPAFQITLDAADAIPSSNPVISAAEPIVAANDEGSILYQLTHGTGTEGLILFNQSAMMLGVLSRRGRSNGQDYAALLGPGESRFLPARVVAEGSLGKHAWNEEADSENLTSSTLTQFFDRALVAVSSTDGDDPDNRFLDPSDSDWGTGWSTDVDATPPPGTSYSVGEDGSVTIHNDSDVDIAVISPYHGVWSDQGLAVLRPGQSYTISETATNPLGFNAYWVQGERQDGRSVVIAQVITAGGQVLVAPAAEGHPDQSRWLPLRGTAPIDTDGIDPGDRFLDPSDYLAPGSALEPSYGNPETAGVTYSVVDDDTIRIHNDGTGAIAVMQSTPGGQLLGFDILAPGESKVYGSVPGGYAMVSVQAERGADGKPVLLGGVMKSPFDGTITGTAPYDGYPAIPLRHTPLPENHAPTGEVVAQPKPADQRERVYSVEGFDINGDTLTFSIHTPPSRGTLTDNGDGTFTYTPTDPDDLHEGFVDDQFLIQISDGRGGTALAPAFVYYGFANVNEAPAIESVVGGVNDLGGGGWHFVVSDPDGDPIGIDGFDRPTYGVITVTPVNGDVDPISGAYTVVPGQFVVTYEPDLVRAHESAYDDEFTVTFDDGHGGTVSETITVHVPFYNTNPYVYLHDPSGGVGSGTGTYEITTFDDENDTVTIVSATSERGATITIVDGVLHYTPNPGIGDAYYADRITVVGDDGHGGTYTTSRTVRVMNTTNVVWVDEGRGEVLVFTEFDMTYPDTPLERHGERVVVYPYDYEQARAFVEELENSSIAGEFGDYRQMLQAYEDALNAPEPEPEGPDWGEPGPWIPGDGEYELPGYDADDEPASAGDVDNFLLELLGSFDFIHNLGEVWSTMLAYDDFEDFAAKLSDQLSKLETVSDDAPILKYSKYVFKTIGPVGTLLSLGIATAQLNDADTPNEELLAQIELLSAATPAVMAATGAVLLGVIGGPGAALVGLNIGAIAGTAIGLGLSIGAELSLNENFRDAFQGALEQPANARDWWPF